MHKHALILGAKSDIARAIARQFAEHGYHLYLAGRKASQSLAADASDLAIRYKISAKTVDFDALDYDTHAQVWAGLDPMPEVVICVVGYMPEQSDAEQDAALMRTVLETNFVGCAHFLHFVAHDFEARKAGAIIGVSSVAGDRGRAKNYYYGSAKAGFSAYLSGMRNRLHKAGVQVLTVKPGFVRTRMTENMDLPGLLTADPEEVANDIYTSWSKEKNVIYSKWFWRWIMLIITCVPESIFKKLNF